MTYAIDIKGLTKTFGQEKAVDDFSISIETGETFAFLGSNGSGKTTTMRCLLNIYQPDSGELLINGQRYSSDMSSQIGYLPEERGLYTKSKVMDIFMYFGNLRGIESREVRKNAENYLERVGLSAHRDKVISQLSSGMQQKIQIGVTIQHNPSILILDEPFKGLDPVNRQLFIDIFRELKEQGTTILYSTHAVDEAQKLSDKLAMIKNGKRVLYGTINEVRRSQGTDNLQVEFIGKFPINHAMYTARVEQKTAEITPAEGISSQEILKYLVNEGLQITEMKVDMPSLNEVFIKVAKADAE